MYCRNNLVTTDCYSISSTILWRNTSEWFVIWFSWGEKCKIKGCR